MPDVARWGLAGGVALLELGACRAPAPEAAPPREVARDAAAAPARDAGRLPFIRTPPPLGERRSVDACAFDDGRGSACVDALVREPEPVRAKYMRRIARARVGRGAAAAAREETAECCNTSGPCGAPKKSGHADCPTMDDGYACLVAAELGRVGAHARACRCDAERAQIPTPGGSLACDAERPMAVPPMAEAEADDVIACASCTSAAACDRETERVDADVAAFLRRVVVTRCTLP